MYKVSLQTQGKFESHQYIDKTALLLVSVGKEYHEGIKLSCTIDKINQSGFGSCVIAVADTLQRHNYYTNVASDNYRRSLDCGTEWIRNNNEHLSKLKMKSKVLRWDECLHRKEFKHYYDKIVNEYYSNENYRQSINETIGVFAERNNIVKGTTEYENIFYRSLFYILEECPIIMPMWADDGIHFIIYPKQMTNAMSKTRDIFVREKNDEYVNWISLKFRKKSLSPNDTATEVIENE
jgi:hypothetical protein